jgi:hypothetical protein
MRILLQKIIVCFIAGCFISAAAFALPPQKLIFLDEWLYDALTALSLEQRDLFITDATMSVAQIEQALTVIDEESLSPGGALLYKKIRAYLAEEGSFSVSKSLFALNFSVNSQPEFYYKTNDETGWTYDKYYRHPFLTGLFDVSISKYINLGTEVYLAENRRLSDSNNNYFNFPFDTMIDGVQPLDINIPKRAYLNMGLPLGSGFGIDFRIGIGDDSWGRTKTGSIVLSDHMKGASYMGLYLYSPFVNYAAEIKQLEVTKYFYSHHFQVNLFKRFSFSLVEGVMVNAPFELRYLNPAMVFHGFTAWESYREYNWQIGNEDFAFNNSRVGSFLGVIADFRPWKYGRIYGLFGLNEFQIPGELDNRDITVPNGMAFQLGYESYIPVPRGHWTFGVEGVYTYPYMYILENKDWSYFRESYEVSNPVIREWTGTPFGPDSIAGTLWLGYRDSSQWSISSSFLFLVQGENADTGIFGSGEKPETGNSYYSNTREEMLSTTPTGTPEFTYMLSLQGEWSPAEWISVFLQPSYKFIRGHNHRDGKTAHGFEAVLSVKLTPAFIPSSKRNFHL